MPLSCSCDSDEYDSYYEPPNDYRTYPVATRRKKCSSCGDFINGGSACTEFKRYRFARTDIEEKIYGEGCEIWLASVWLCERCSDLYFSFEELGYECVGPWENMVELAKEYGETHAHV
jgi:hypothetical protein